MALDTELALRSVKVSDIAGHLDPVAAAWSAVPTETVEMMPAPLGLQPNDYIIASWENRAYGELAQIETQSVHDGEHIVVRMVWDKAKPSAGAGESFPDAAALTFPVRGDPLLMEMGAPDAPIHALQWKARGNEVRSVAATGIGKSMPGVAVSERGQGGWSGGRWHVVMARTLNGPQDAAIIAPGVPTRIGFVVWDGSNEERAGIKAVSLDCIDFLPDA